VPAGSDFSLEIAGERQPMCCPGCKAVAGLIADSGLERFYAQRTAFNERPAPDLEASPGRFVIYDDDALAEQFCDPADDGMTDARLLIGGVSCAACTWLIETTLQRHPGVSEASLNLTQGRLDVRFDRGQLAISELFAGIAALGYSVQPWQTSAQQELARADYRRDMRRLAVAGIGMMQVGMFAIALHAGDIQGISDEYQRLLRLFSLLVTGFVVAFSARGFFESAWRHLRQGALVMDLPVALAIGLAFAASTIATFAGDGDVYFDSVVMFTFLLLLARFVEKRMRYRDAIAWQDAEQTLPDAAQLRRGDSWITVPRREIAAGDRVLVRAGATIPIDGLLLEGSTAVREDSFSGEALPRTVARGDRVYAGTLNLDNTLELEATGSYADTRLAALQRSIDTARHDKPALARLADRIATRFIAAVLFATAITALAWWQIDPERAFWVALSVLVISCPCALSLATPATLANAAALLRRRGVIVHGENALESLSRVTHALFDKTGTLTTGEFRIDHIEALTDNYPRAEIERIAATLQRHSNHPLASAFSGFDTSSDLHDIRYIVGAGLEGRCGSRRLRLGSLAFCRELAPGFPGSPHYTAVLDCPDGRQPSPGLARAGTMRCAKRSRRSSRIFSGRGFISSCSPEMRPPALHSLDTRSALMRSPSAVRRSRNWIA
jgi:Cu2+-exporting ATPase